MLFAKLVGNKREDIQDDWNTWRLVFLQLQSLETSFTAQHKTLTSGSYILFTGALNTVEDMPWINQYTFA